MPYISRHDFEIHYSDLLSGEGCARLRAGDPASVERAIAYIEADPTHVGSGYARENIIRLIKTLAFSELQLERLRVAILQAVDRRDRREFRSLCRLAAAVKSSGFMVVS